MKSTVIKIAMILIIVMVVNLFTGCSSASISIDTSGIERFATGVLIGTLVVGVVYGLIIALSAQHKLNKRPPRRANPNLFENSKLNAAVKSLSEEELDSLTRTFSSLPEKELNLFVNRLNSMSKQETVSLIESINVFSEEEFAAIVGTFNSMNKTETASSLEYLNSLPKTVPLASIVKSIDVDVSGEKAPAAHSLR